MSVHTARHVSNLESTRAAEARSRFFPQARHAYLRSALEAAVTLKTADADYLDRMGNRDYHARVRASNLQAYMREVHPPKPQAMPKPWYVLW